jgi:FixJ family two-component response regulator
MGVFDFLEKPVDGGELLDCVQKALARDVQLAYLSPSLGLITPVERRKAEEVSATLSQLTARRKEVLDLLMAGRTLKEIAIHFQITVQGAWKHQQKIFAEFGIENEVDLMQVVLGTKCRSSAS